MAEEKNSDKSSSTLSLHIAAYENSIEAAASVDEPLNEKDGTGKINKKLCGLDKKVKNVKKLFISSPPITNVKKYFENFFS